jgi:hypothetical protein
MNKSGCAALAAMLSFSSATAAFGQWAGCPNKPSSEQRASAIDTAYAFDPSDPGAGRFLQKAREKGVRTVIRYYDWAHRPGEDPLDLDPGKWEQAESICQKIYTPKRCGGALTAEERRRIPPERCVKTLSAAERDLILSHGLNILVVFQHFNECVETWLDQRRAAYDAKRALELAKALSQPAGTAIYFGVDGADEKFRERGEADHGMSHIAGYFRTIAAYLKPAGYKVGVYGSGYVCRAIKDEAGLADYCWLSQSSRHSESASYAGAGRWTLKQCLSTTAYNNLGGEKHEVDPNVVNPGVEDFGQWKPVMEGQAGSADGALRLAAPGALGRDGQGRDGLDRGDEAAP